MTDLRIVSIPTLIMVMALGAAASAQAAPADTASAPAATAGDPEQPRLNCSAALPVPTDVADVQCWIAVIAPTVRCRAMSTADCGAFISSAYTQGLLTPAATAWVINNHWCPLLLDVGSGLELDGFCPGN